MFTVAVSSKWQRQHEDLQINDHDAALLRFWGELGSARGDY